MNERVRDLLPEAEPWADATCGALPQHIKHVRICEISLSILKCV